MVSYNNRKTKKENTIRMNNIIVALCKATVYFCKTAMKYDLMRFSELIIVQYDLHNQQAFTIHRLYLHLHIFIEVITQPYFRMKFFYNVIIRSI
jgi:hypothetical protein